jgi:hypothetical protein
LTLRVDAAGDLIYFDGTTDISLTTAAPGNVQGPGSSTDNALVRFDGVLGTTIQNSGVIVDDNNDITGVRNLTLTNGDLHLMLTGDVLGVVTIDATNGVFDNVDVTDLDIGGSNFEDLIMNPAGAVNDNRVVRFDGTGGQDVQESGIAIDDSDNVTGINDIEVGGVVTSTLTVGDGTGSFTTPSLTINMDSGDAKLRLQVNDNPSTAWDLALDNSADDDLIFDYNGMPVLTLCSDNSTPIQVSAQDLPQGNTPDANTLYANLIPKAFASVSGATGTLNDGVNLTCTRSGTGQYDYTLLTPMANSNYAVSVMCQQTGSSMRVAKLETKVTGSFSVRTQNLAGTDTDTNHSVIVIGEQ